MGPQTSGPQRYVPMDMGASSENIFLQAMALGLGTYIIGAFVDKSLRRALGVTEEQTPRCVMPVGRR